ncbi:acetyl-CoA synthetase-like protein [Colletotrichum somersetense]|nr:acetyl-CoA synthetase-like protein [Colletotrichum somersetense]
MQMVWQAGTQGLSFSVSDVYKNPTISQLAAAISVQGNGTGTGEKKDIVLAPTRTAFTANNPRPFSLIPQEEKVAVELNALRCYGISANDIEDIYPATDTQVGLLLQTEQAANLWVANDQWELPEGFDVARFQAAWDIVVEKCPILRTRILQIDSGPRSRPKAYQVVLRSGCRHSGRSSSSRQTSGDNRSQNDEWSTQLILGLVADIYNGRTPKETRPFSYYVRTLQGLNKEAARAFWETEMAGFGAEGLQSCIFPCGNTTPLSRYSSVSRPAAQSKISRKIKMCGPSHATGTTVAIPTILEAAWALVLSAYAGTQDVLLGVVQSGRITDKDPEILSVVGPTISTVPRRICLDKQQTVGAFLQACQRRAQEVVPYEACGLKMTRKILARHQASLHNLLVIQAGIARHVPENVYSADGPTAVHLRQVSTGTESAKVSTYPFGLVLECVIPSPQGGAKSRHMELVTWYDDNYIDRDMIECLLSHFENVLDQLVRLPFSTALGKVSIWMPDQAISPVNLAPQALPPIAVEACVHDLISRHWSIDSPLLNRPAVVMRGSRHGGVRTPLTLTYRDLDAYSRIICSLITQKAEFQSANMEQDSSKPPFIAICLEKSHWTVAAMIGAWRAGAAILLLDPGLPPHYLYSAAQKVKSALVLVSPTTQSLWDQGFNSPLNIDMSTIKRVVMSFPPKESPPPEETALRSSTPEDICYCVFTSGSTSEPKGVLVPHRAISTSAVHHGRKTGINHTSRVLQFSSYAFDVSMDEIVTTLIHGGCVCVIGDQDRRSPIGIADAMEEMDVNLALLTPAVLSTLEPDKIPECLETLVVGGSVMNEDLLSQWDRQVRLLVAYGPSECSVTATMNEDVSNRPLGNIGHPVGCRAWVLGSAPRHLCLLPLGCVGELVIEGPILAQGYIGDPDLTSQRFILASSVEGEFCKLTGYPPETRLYRTGDLVRQTSDGSFLFLGRVDSEVKVRGVRVELEAIERCVVELTEIRDAVVIYPQKGSLLGRLVAVVQSGGDDNEGRLSMLATADGSEPPITPIPHDLSKTAMDRMKERLPSSHIPMIWVNIARMPLLRSGKVDRTLLRRRIEDFDALTLHQDDLGYLGFSSSRGALPSREDSQKPASFASSPEAQIKNLMGRVLGVDLSSAPDTSTFTRLGGDSLLAMQFVSKAKIAGITGVSMAMLLGGNSIAELVRSATAATLTARPVAQTSSSMIRPTLPTRLKVQDIARDTEAFIEQRRVSLTFAQRLFFTHYPFGPNYFNQSVSLAIDNKHQALNRTVGWEDVQRYLLHLIERHQILRSRFWRRCNRTPDGIEAWHWESVVTNDVPGSLRFRKHMLGKPVDIKEIITETHQTLNISSGPVFAADLFCLQGGSLELVLVAHHLVVDIISWSIILGDLEAMMFGVDLGPTPAPLALDTSYPEIKQSESGPHFAGSASDDATAHTFWGVTDRASGPLTTAHTVRFVTPIGRNASRHLSNAVALIDHLDVGDVIEAVVAEVFTNFCCERGRISPPLIYTEDHGRNFYAQEEGKLSSSRVGWLTQLRSVDNPTPNLKNSLLEAIWRARNARRRLSSVAQGNTSSIPPLPLEVVINYTGKPLLRSQGSNKSRAVLFQSVSPTTMTELAAVQDTDPCLPPLSLIEVLATWRDEEGLELTVTYNARIQHAEMIQSCIGSCVRVLRDEVIPNLSATSASAWRNSLRMLPVLGDETADYATSQGRRDELIRSLGLATMDEIEAIERCNQGQNQILMVQAQAKSRVPTSLLYHVQASWDVSTTEADDDGLNLARLAKACETVVRHHPALRTVFVQLPHMVSPVQVILRDGSHNKVLRMTPKRRSAGPRSATSVVRLDLDINHASFDGYSSAVLLRDIGLAYAGKTLSPQTASVTHRYLSYIEQAQNEIETADAFWDKYLQDVKPCHLLPLGPGPGAEKGSNSDPAIGFFDERMVFEEGGKTGSISSFCRRFGVTMATAIHMAWAMALSAYQYSDSGTYDICFGWLSSGRDLPVSGLEDAIGMFAHLLVSRIQVAPGVLLRDFMATMARGMAEGLQHQLGRPRLYSQGEALFDTILSIQSISNPEGLEDHGDLCFRQTEGLDRVGQSFCLNIGISKDKDSDIDCRITHDCARVSEAAARALFAVFRQALTSIISTQADSVATIADIDLFPPVHLQLARDMNKDSAHEISRPFGNLQRDKVTEELGLSRTLVSTTIVSLFSRQLHARPHAVAVAAWDATLTNSELETLSRALCKHLVASCGLSRGRNVVLLCDKSAWVVVAMLAVFRAGAACAFLNPADGSDRLRKMVEQTGAGIIIVSPAHEDKTRKLLRNDDKRKRKILVLNPEWDIFTRPSNEASSLDHCRSDDVALVLFTSGSTGSPKGIRLAHSSLCLSVLNYTSRLGISRQTRIFQFSAYTFDVGVGDMLASLIVGAVLCVPSEQDRLSDLNGAIHKSQATCLIATPSVAALLRPDRLKNSNLNTLVLIGELATTELYQTWHGHVRLFNAYGPAECSVLSTIQYVRSPNENPAIIGHGLAPHCRVWLVDPTDPSRLVPVGAPGEAMIEGHHVALGYLNSPEKTAKAFLSVDKAPKAILPLLPAARLYLTGDLMRLVPHQGLVFMGRKDLQIKLRGQRIEVGEIEFHVRRRILETFDCSEALATPSPSVADRIDHGIRVMAAVISIKQLNGQECLVAFISIIREDGESVEREQQDENRFSRMEEGFFTRIKSQLSDDLSPHMVPSIFLWIQQLPQTSSGKIDRKRLQRIAAKSISRPSKDLEEETSGIGPDSHFFRLGGDSILAMRLAAASLDEGTCLPVSTIMKFPVLSHMAAALDQSRSADACDASNPSTSLPKSNSEDIQDSTSGAAIPSFTDTVRSSPNMQKDFPTTSFQEAVVTFNMAPARGFLNYFVLKLDPRIDEDRLGRAFSALLAQQPVLRLAFSNMDGHLVQRIRPLEAVKIQKLNIGTEGGSTQMYGIDEHVASFIIRGPVKNALRLIVRLSHALYDGMCLSTLWDNLSTAYDDGDYPMTSTSEQNMRFFQFVSSETLHISKAAKDFWHGLLHGSYMTPVIHKADNQITTSPLKVLPNSGLMEGRISLKVPSRNFYMASFTPASVLKAAWAVVLAGNIACTTCCDVVFGQVVSCRETLEPSMYDVFGPFINCIPVRLVVPNSDPSTLQTGTDSIVRDLAQQAQAQHIAGLAYHTIGLNQLAQLGLSHPRFHSIVQYQNLPKSKATALCGIESGPLRGTSIEVNGRSGAYADVWVTAFPADNDRIEVEICYDGSVVQDAVAQTLLETLCRVLRNLCM